MLFAILQKYDFSSKSQHGMPNEALEECCLRYCKSTIFQANHNEKPKTSCRTAVVCDTAKVRFFKQITTRRLEELVMDCCLRYCKSTIFQANHNGSTYVQVGITVVCDTAKVRFFKQITTKRRVWMLQMLLFAILQKYDFSSKSQHTLNAIHLYKSCLRYCKSTIFQANHNSNQIVEKYSTVVCDTAKVRFFKQITTR